MTTRFVWERFRLLQEIQDEVPLTYVYSDEGSYDPLARIDGSENPEIYWFHNQPNGTPERLTDAEGQLRWEGQNSAWGKLLRESSLQGPGFAQNLRMQGQYLDRETGLHYNLFRYYDPDCGRFTQPDPIGLNGGLNLYSYAPNTLIYIDPLGLKCTHSAKNPKQAHAAIKDKWGHNMTPKEMRELQNTVDNIKLNRSAYARDGITFENNYRMSPNSQRLDTGSGPYKEWTVKTPGVGNRGTRRIVVDTKTGKAYYSHDHYDSFIEIELGGWR